VLPIAGEIHLHEKAVLKFDIKLFDVEKDFVFKTQLNTYQSETIQKEQLIPLLTYVSTFTAEVPYKLDAWQNGKDIKVTDKNIMLKLRTAYNWITEIINTGNYDAFKKEIIKRESNMAVSMYLAQTEKDKRINDLIADFKSGFKAMPLPADAILQVYGYGKVVALKKLNGESALYLENKKTEEEIMLDLTFYIPQGKDDFFII